MGAALSVEHQAERQRAGRDSGSIQLVQHEASVGSVEELLAAAKAHNHEPDSVVNKRAYDALDVALAQKASEVMEKQVGEILTKGRPGGTLTEVESGGREVIAHLANEVPHESRGEFLWGANAALRNTATSVSSDLQSLQEKRESQQREAVLDGQGTPVAQPTASVTELAESQKHGGAQNQGQAQPDALAQSEGLKQGEPRVSLQGDAQHGSIIKAESASTSAADIHHERDLLADKEVGTITGTSSDPHRPHKGASLEERLAYVRHTMRNLEAAKEDRAASYSDYKNI